MARINTIAALICSVFLLPLVASNDVHSTKTHVVVEGMVYCQKCDQFGSWSLEGAQPIDGAKISVTCKNYRNQVSYYKTYKTDTKGFFFAQLDGFKMTHGILEHPLQACHVKLLSSPLKECRLLSNINNGLDGAPLTFVKNMKRSHYEAALYTVSPLAFRPNKCPNKIPIY